MDKELLFKFLRCETTPQEECLLAEWLEADPDHRRELNRMRITMEGLALSTPAWSKTITPKQSKEFQFRRIILRSVAAAAVIAIAVSAGFGIASHRESANSNRLTAIEVPAGNRLSLTLSDGTHVWLNAGTKLEYPAFFHEKKRHVKVTGEAMFEVSHSADQPFVVETFACDIEVLGTKFNVSADETTRSFSTALMDGSIRLASRITDDAPFIMQPNEEVNLVSGRLTLREIANPDEYLWPEGIISIGNTSFAELMVKFERIFDVKIEIRRSRVPVIEYPRGKIRVADGIDHTLSVLQMTTAFKYRKDSETGVVTIL